NGADLNEPTREGAPRGAIVEVVWPRQSIVPPRPEPGAPLGENQRFEA
ncbi:MAG: sensor histidine kinase, partial [Rhodobacteraceae bacterium]|nr:sensor histidine kinase [Paracoccaceae bacterium]